MAPLTALATSAERQALVPMVCGYLILMSALALGLRRLCRSGATRAGSGPAHREVHPDRPPAGPRGSPRQPGWAALARLVAGTVVGGYVLLMAVVVGYYFGVARVGHGFLASAATGSALLVGLAAPAFAAASWLADRLQRRSGGATGSRQRRDKSA